MVLAHFYSIGIYFAVGDPFEVDATERVVGWNPFCENISVQIYFFQICKNRLTVFRNGKGIANTADIIGSVLQVTQNQVRKIDEGIIINPALPVMAS